MERPTGMAYFLFLDVWGMGRVDMNRWGWPPLGCSVLQRMSHVSASNQRGSCLCSDYQASREMSFLAGLASEGCCNKLLQTCLLSWPTVRRLEVPNQGVDRAMFPLKPLGKNSSLYHLRLWRFLAILGFPGLWSCSVALSGLTLGGPMDRSPPGSSVHGISQARILVWVTISSFRGSSRSRDRQADSLPLNYLGSWLVST